MRIPEGDDPGAPRPGAREGAARDDERDLEPAAGIGPRVSAVFTAAEQAAEHILSMARAEAADLRRHAEAEVAAIRSQRRQDAEREARAIVDEARAQADAIRAEAGAAGRAVEEAARRRAQWIDEGIRLMVERAEWGRRGLGEVLSRLGEFVERHPSEWGEVPPVATTEAVATSGPPEPDEPPAGRPEAAGDETDGEGLEAPTRGRSPVADDREPDDIPPLPSSPTYVEGPADHTAGGVDASLGRAEGGEGEALGEESESVPESEPGGDDPWRKGEDIYREDRGRDDGGRDR